MKILIVDDEPLARDELKCLLADEDDIQIIGECGNAIDAIAAINRQSPDVVFLDIQMPRVSGLEMLSMLDPDRMPAIVFLTAHDEYAVKAFEEHAFDYLLKPADSVRLSKTLHRLRRDHGPRDMAVLKEAAELRQIPCLGQNRIYLLKTDDVHYAAAKTGGVFVAGPDGQERFTELTLRVIEERTPLIRCHRQYLVHPDHVREIRFPDNQSAEILVASGQIIPVSRRFLTPLKEHLGIA